MSWLRSSIVWTTGPLLVLWTYSVIRRCCSGRIWILIYLYYDVQFYIYIMSAGFLSERQGVDIGIWSLTI